MRILHVIVSDGVAGAEKYLIHLLPGLKEYGITASLLVIYPVAKQKIFEQYASKFYDTDVTVTLIKSKSSFSPAVLTAVRNVLRSGYYDIIHSHLIRTDLLIYFASLLSFSKTVLLQTVHGYNELQLLQSINSNGIVKKDLFYYVQKFILKRFDYTFMISQSMADLFVKNKLYAKKQYVIRHGIYIDQSEILHSQQQFASPTILVAGRLADVKGQKYLLKALPAVLEKIPDVQLQLLGLGPAEEQLRRIAKDLKIEANVHFMGFQLNPYKFMQVAHVIVIPSIFEPFGLVYLEAMALGKAIISFETPISEEILKNNENAILVKNKDVNSLAEGIIKLLQDTPLRTMLGENARRVYTEKYTKDIMVKNTADYYHHIKGAK